MPQRHNHRPCQRGKIDHACGLEPLLRIPQHIGQHQTALGIGVNHLDRHAAHRFHHIARTLRTPVGHILDQTDKPYDIRLGAAQRQSAHHPGHHARAAHIHRHLFHPARGFDGNAAGVKHHTLTHQRQGCLALDPAAPLHYHHF